MKKDLSSLGLLPSIILGMLGHSSGISLLRLLSELLGQPLQADGVESLEYYRWIVAILFAICPWLVLLINALRRGTKRQTPLLPYFTYIPLLLIFALIGWVVEIYTLRVFQGQVDELLPGEQWLFAVGDLHPLKAGIGGMMFCWLLLFFFTPFMERDE